MSFTLAMMISSGYLSHNPVLGAAAREARTLGSPGPRAGGNCSEDSRGRPRTRGQA